MDFEETKKRILILGIFILIVTFCLPSMCDLLVLSYKDRTKYNNYETFENRNNIEYITSSSNVSDSTEELSQNIGENEAYFTIEKSSDGAYKVIEGGEEYVFETFEEVQAFYEKEQSNIVFS